MNNNIMNKHLLSSMMSIILLFFTLASRSQTVTEVSTHAGNGVAQSVDGLSKTALFSQIRKAINDAAGNIYIIDFNKIRKISPSGQVTTLAGNDLAGYADGPGSQARFLLPQALCLDDTGNVYVAE